MKYTLIIILVFLSNCLLAQTNIDSLELLVDKKEGKEKVNLLNKISYNYWNMSPNKGIEFGKLGLEEAISNNYPKGKAMSYNSIGVNYWAKGEFETSLSFYYKSLEISEELEDGDLISSCINNIAMIYARLKQYDKAIEFYKKAKEIAISLENVRDQIKYNNNIGNVFMRMEKYEEATPYFFTNLELSEKLNDSYLIALSNHNIGLSYYRQDNLEEAIVFFIKAFDMFLDISNLNYASSATRFIGLIYIKQQKFPQALEFLTKAEKFAIESQSLENLSLIEHDLSAYYVAIDDYKTAFLYENKYQAIKDSLFNQKNSKQIAEMHTKYETEKKEAENKLLLIENEKQTNIRNTFIGVSVLVIILIIVLFSRFWIKKKANFALSQKNILIENQKEQLVITNEKLTKQNEQVNLLNATKDKFFSIIAHDLKNPFTVILGFADLLSSDYDNLDDTDRKKYISEISRSSESTYSLLENLLDWAISQQGRLKLTKEKLNLKELINLSIEPYKSMARKKNINLKNTVSDEIIIEADKYTITTSIGNIVNNAIKFTPPGGQITIDAISDSNQIEISIKDSGVGMSQKQILNLFRIEESFSTSGTNNEKGTGLGLILCQEFIEKNGGNIKVESKIGKGSKFTISLPKNGFA
jgi:signal transduction histidine kinase/Tfp pilus assembly protein PilF